MWLLRRLYCWLVVEQSICLFDVELGLVDALGNHDGLLFELLLLGVFLNDLPTFVGLELFQQLLTLSGGGVETMHNLQWTLFFGYFLSYAELLQKLQLSTLLCGGFLLLWLHFRFINFEDVLIGGLLEGRWQLVNINVVLELVR